ncbi:MAG TPA: rhomboid family intramembrane serine protease [Kofleriaceae bacterium]|nr:rhomboid family intramembrane serine protease [Kofleriaceae bacterium]
MSGALRSRFSGMRITRGALIVLGLEVGLSLVYLASDLETRGLFQRSLIATPDNVFVHGRVWTLATSVFVEPNALALVLHALVMWMFVPTLERFWGRGRFYRFVAITSLVATAAGCALGYALGGPYHYALVGGLDPFIYAAIVAFGIVYARQPVQFFGVLPLTGRQLMYGILGFLALLIVLTQRWHDGAADAAAMLAAAVLTSKRWSPSLAWKRWRIARARARLTVMSGGKARSTPPRDEHKWLN